MVSTWIQLTICFVLVFGYIQIGQSHPLVDLYGGDEQYSNENSYFPQSRLAQQFKLAEPMSDERNSIYYLPLRSKSSDGDHLRLTKRIIMLPRVGRRSINQK